MPPQMLCVSAKLDCFVWFVRDQQIELFASYVLAACWIFKMRLKLLFFLMIFNKEQQHRFFFKV